MKHLKPYKVFEQQSKNNLDIIYYLNKYLIKNYTINEDGTIDVNGDVDLGVYDLDKIPFKFGIVTGYFNCSNNKLTSLYGCPREVGGQFHCLSNRLTNLIGGPQEVGRDYRCDDNRCDDNRLESLEGCAGDIGSTFNCSSVINGDIKCRYNKFKEEPEFFGVCGGKIIWK